MFVSSAAPQQTAHSFVPA